MLVIVFKLRWLSVFQFEVVDLFSFAEGVRKKVVHEAGYRLIFCLFIYQYPPMATINKRARIGATDFISKAQIHSLKTIAKLTKRAKIFNQIDFFSNLMMIIN